MPSRFPLAPAASPPELFFLRHRHPPTNTSRLVSPLVATAAAISVILFIAILYRKLTRKRTAPAPPSDHQHLAGKQPLRRFSFSLLRRATSSFSPSNRLGQGGFGSVYRGLLPSGEVVAVKVMDTAGSLQGEREFQNELSLASRISVDGTVASRSPFVVSILGYSSDKRGQRKVLVYELMENGSLQDKLLDRKCAELIEWEKRFKIILDVARALHFLHELCGPTPVIHGDVKPSNVLLDREFNAKLGDFGLARVLEENGDDDSRALAESAGEVKVRINGGEENGSIAEETESLATCFEEGLTLADRSPESYATRTVDGDGASPEPTAVTVAEASPSEGFEKVSLSESCTDKISLDSGNRKVWGKKKGDSGRDWWWKQDGNERGSESGRVKDYVMEWIGNEIKKERPKSTEWVGTSSTANVSCGANLCKKLEPKKNKKRLDWWNSLDSEDLFWKKDKSRRKPREWWREEFCEELAKKNRKKKKKKKDDGSSNAGDLWWQRDEDFTPERKKRKSRTSLGSIDWWLDGLSGELRSGRRNSQDWASGDIPKSGGISSTPSMRGTVCYIAPEYGGGGLLSDKCDVYSFGVLMLVVISGRRPLQVTASPMSEFERANLISWARQLAYNGKLLDLVDPLIQSLDREQGLLCITIALLCLQRSPSKRPNMKVVVEMLCGETEPPHLPFEFSPSPPSNFPFKSRKKARCISALLSERRVF